MVGIVLWKRFQSRRGFVFRASPPGSESPEPPSASDVNPPVMGAALRMFSPQEHLRRMEAAESLLNDPEAQADLALMTRVRDGDREAVIGIVDRFQHELIGFFYRLSWDQLAAEELAQDVFVRLYHAREHWQPTARLRTWIYRIAHNLWIDHLRRKRSLVSLDAEQIGRAHV